MAYSNCLITALIVKWRLGGKIKLRRPCQHYLFGHWVVRLNNRTIHFRADELNRPWWKHLWFKGRLSW